MKNIIEFFRKDNIENPPWNYYFILNLDEKDYPRYLAKLFYINTGEKLSLRHGEIDKRRCNTFNQKIQWIKLYGVTPLMRDCTDKVKVRDFVKEKIGEEYLKPVLQIIPNESHETMRCHCEQVNDNLGLAWQSTDRSNDTLDCHVAQIAAAPRNDIESDDVSTYFDQIDFDKFPNSFVMKTNHGCKWQYIIKNKEEYIKNKRLFDITKKQMTNWLKQEYWCFSGFEMQYKGIKPKILIEPLLRENINEEPVKINVYCFKGEPKFIYRFYGDNTQTVYNEKFEFTEDLFKGGEKISSINSDEFIKQSFVLSKQLSKNFDIVRVDWMLFKNKLYFEEMTFTPYSGFHKLKN